MDIEINMLDLDEDEVEIIEIFVNVGDQVKNKQPLINVKGKKLSMEIHSPQEGIVKNIQVAIGDKISSGKSIMTLEQSIDNTISKSTNICTEKVHEKWIVMPDVDIDKTEITEILVKVGDIIKTDQSIVTIEGDKASIEIPSPFSGIVKEIKVNIGDKVRTGSYIMKCTVVNDELSIESNRIKNSSTICQKTDDQSINIEHNSYVHATPVIRRLAREFGINLENIKGTGNKGRILREDIQIYIKEMLKCSQVTPVNHFNNQFFPNLSPFPKIDFNKFGETKEIELGRIQKISGANLHRNWITIPHITQFDEVDISEVEIFRKQQNIESEKKHLDLKITLLVFIIKAVAKALEKFPYFNSSLSENGQTLILKKYINIGIAVDTPDGLVVPVLIGINKKGILELSRELSEVSKKARAGKLISSDMQGGCFTISSLGGIGGTGFTPIVNTREVALLGVSKSLIKPIWNGKKFSPRMILPLSLSYDHRVINGADGARFISFINIVMSDIRQLIM